MPVQDLKIETNNSSIRQWKNNYNELVNEAIRLEIEKLDLDGSDIMTGPLRVGDGNVTFNNDILQNLASGSINAHQILSNNTSDLEFQLNASDFELVLDSTSLFNLNSSNLNVSVPITMPAGSNIDGNLIVDETRLVLPTSDPGGPLDGLMSYQDKDKLDDIEADAQVNVSHDLDRILSTTNATITITNGTNTTIPLVDKDGNATFPNGTAGLMSPDDKTALDTLVSTSGEVTNLGTTVIAGLRTITSSTGSNVEIPNATTTDPGFMGSAQVTSLNNKFDTAGTALSKDGTTINADLASKAQAEAGTNNTVLMTPLRVEEHGADNWVPLERTLTAGTGLTGGGDLSTDLSFNVTYGDTTGTACEGNDARLSDARDWDAIIVSQTEAEAGGSQTARKWTAQRVHQAAVEAVTETDPVFSASPAAGISSDNISDWNTAHSWGDHGSAGYALLGDNASASSFTVGYGSGSVGLTINDSHGNANVTFNHSDGIADVAGNCGRIVVNVDSSVNPSMSFELAENDATGAVTTAQQMNLTDSGLNVQNRVTADAFAPDMKTVTPGSTTTFDMTTGSSFVVTLNQNTTFNFNTDSASYGMSGTIVVKQDNTGGRTFTLPAAAKTPVAGADINQITNPGTVSILGYFVVDASTILVNYIGDFQ